MACLATGEIWGSNPLALVHVAAYPSEHFWDIDTLGVPDALAVVVRDVGVDGQHRVGAAEQVWPTGVSEAETSTVVSGRRIWVVVVTRRNGFRGSEASPRCRRHPAGRFPAHRAPILREPELAGLGPKFLPLHPS
jgi:hypothetical protein